jgi:glycosyltransferase involved in cell wall biosynthesis
MSSSSLDVSVVICTHTEARWSYLIEAVQSAQNQSLAPLEIVVVVDHNTALQERIRTCLPQVVVVENQEPKGASGSKNSGINAARGAVVAFLDDDAVADPDWLEQLMVEFENPNVIGAGGMTIPRWSGTAPAWFPEEFYWIIGCTHRGMPETIAPVRNLIACNMAVRRAVFQEIGGFRNGMGPSGKHALGCEETEWCIRASQRWPEKVWLHKPTAKARHQVPASRARWRYFFRRCYGEGLSKALVAQFVGANDGLASERAYTLQTLPAGVLRGVTDAVLHGRLVGLAQAGAIVAGLAVTAVGYAKGIASQRLGRRPDRSQCQPVA